MLIKSAAERILERKQDYINEAYNQLNDMTYYEQITADATSQCMSAVQKTSFVYV